MNVGMLHDNVLLRLDGVEQGGMTSSGKLYIPDNAQNAPQTATVVAVGPGRWLEGVFVKTQVTEGARVLFPKYDGMNVEIEGQSFVSIRESALIAVLV